MTGIDIDAIGQRAGNYAKTPIGSHRTILAIELANEAVPLLLAKVYEMTAALAEATATANVRQGQLAQSRAQAATYANEIGLLTAENARVRQQRDNARTQETQP